MSSAISNQAHTIVEIVHRSHFSILEHVPLTSWSQQSPARMLLFVHATIVNASLLIDAIQWHRHQQAVYQAWI